MDNCTIKDFSLTLLENFNSTTNRLENFLTSNNVQSEKIKNNLKYIYDFLKQDKNLPQGNGLPELIIDNFGHEEIWSQLELENESLYFRFITDVAKILSKNNICDDSNESEIEFAENDLSDGNVSEKELQLDKSSTDEDTDNDNSNEGNENQENQSENSDGNEENTEKNGRDKFFSMKEMENFLNSEDQKAMNNVKKKKRRNSDESDDSDSIDLFAPSDEESEDNDYNDLHYNQFFDSPEKEGKVENNLENDDKSENEEGSVAEEEEEDEDKASEENVEVQPSTFELRQERLQKKIGHLENNNVGEKSWQLKGEVTANSRPQNSLLEEILDFDVTAKPSIVITEQTNMRLEDIILQRIKDKAWDSVQRKAKPVNDPLEFKKKLALDSEKSKESLAQIYEKEYLKQKESLEPEFKVPDEEPPEKIKTTAMITNLISKLDALSHFYFTPRLVKPEVKIVSNLPAITMEEVAPVTVSDATLLAPEEIKPKKKGVPMAKEERTTTDKKRERRFKKNKQRKRHLEQEKKSAMAIGEPRNKKQAKEQNINILKQVTKDRNVSLMEKSNVYSGKSSEKFFNQLQDQVKNQISTKIKTTHTKSKTAQLTAKKLKL
ncbi:U3 small nucleolar ribonucleoprotein protein MPP10 [Chrysoperla carnea]|uniref:U3 small nucleolar ribonucleoprotein protein MPP10 n=1 Tax=Chrysoperla carnea TaxID=189513 RepID=UPI001D08F56D|nr:U3 small nucleolar ribonucleoprotein protein MPP10 [Chrysoperla carnea]